MAARTEIPTPPTRLRRYMKLEHAVDLLKSGILVFPNPAKWEDRNDLFSLGLYQQLTRHAAVRACCFGSIDATFHHWKVFTTKEDGVCFVFKYAELERSICRAKGMQMKAVNYLNVRELQGKRGTIKPEELPFLKWSRYKDEREHRAIWSSRNEMPQDKVHQIKIDLSCIEKVEISPLLSDEQVETHKQSLLKYCSGPTAHVKVTPSTTTESLSWKNAVRSSICKATSRG